VRLVTLDSTTLAERAAAEARRRAAILGAEPSVFIGYPAYTLDTDPPGPIAPAVCPFGSEHKTQIESLVEDVLKQAAEVRRRFNVTYREIFRYARFHPLIEMLLAGRG
jgi:LmbE family N-acetylglucosaminyl deacetylase